MLNKTKVKIMSNKKQQLSEYAVWDSSVRIFHWVNVLCIIGLLAIGIVILNAKALGVTTDGKILLKTWHVYVGYVFVANLTWRIIWGFIGNYYARWKNVLPFGKQYKSQLNLYMSGKKENRSVAFLGHNPLARIMVFLLFILLTVQGISGLILAGTDVYMPPLGNAMAEWVSEDKAQVELVKPYSKVNVNANSYKEMRAFRKPVINTHYYVFYILLAFIVLHIFAVVYTEIKERNGLVSAMFSGKKVFSEKPVDHE